MNQARGKNQLATDIDLTSGPDSRLASAPPSVLSHEEQTTKLLTQIRDLRSRTQALEKALESIQQSKSWKLTQPLRRFAELKRAYWPLVSFKTIPFKVSPGRHVAMRGDKFFVDGPSAVINLECNSKLPTGWVRLQVKVDCPRGVCGYLYFRTGDGFSGHQRSLLNLLNQGVNHCLLRLPSGVKELRFDPIDPKTEFGLSDFSLANLGSLQLVWRLIVENVERARQDPGAFWVKLKKAWKIFRRGGFVALKAKILGRDFSPDYQEWVNKYDTLSETDRDEIRRHNGQLSYQPLISVVMPVYNVDEVWLTKAIESVERQLYPNWELCIADDASTEEHVWPVLQKAAARNSRIKITQRQTNGHISAASNSALALAQGEFVALLDHDDELTEHALYYMVVELNKYPDADMIYSDEDKINVAGVRLNPYFKSDWNPHLFLQQNFICHLTLYRKQLVERVGGFRAGFEGAQDWDLALRVINHIDENKIRHIPKILYHWRLIEGSTAAATSFKPYALSAQQRAVSEHLVRIGVPDAKVSILEDISHLRVELPLPKELPLVSLIIPTRDQAALLSTCIQSILNRSTFSNFEILIIDNGSSKPEALDYLDRIATDSHVTVIKDPQPFNYSRINNMAVSQAKGQVLGFLNNDLEVLTENWLEEMLSILLRPKVGAVGARLWYPNSLLQHGGVVLGIGGVAGHNHKGIDRNNPGYWNRAILMQNLSGVTGACMLVKREVFAATGGFDEQDLGVAFNDVDLCLKIRKLGYEIVYTPYAEFIHYESVSRGYETTPEKFLRAEHEIQVMKKRWGEYLEADPYYNKNLTLLTEDFALAFPPRTVRPWKSKVS